MKLVRVMGLVLFVIAALPRAYAAGPTCSTFDSANRPAANFDAGDTIIVRGTGFSPNALVLVSFEQGTRTAEISHLKTNDLGAFATDPTTSKLPDAVEVGSGSVQVFQGSGAATCDIRLVSATPTRPHGFGRAFYLTWGVLLTLIAIGLAYATIRRFQAEKLSEELDSIEWQPAEEPVLEEPIVVVDEFPRLDDVVEEPPVFDEPDEPPAGTSDAVARLRREVRSWRS